MPKKPRLSPPPGLLETKETLGLSPALLAKRDFAKIKTWCPNPSNIEYDRWCDPNNPKTIHYSHCTKADEVIKEFVHSTPLMKSRSCKQFQMQLYFKIETVHRTGSFHERSAIYALLMLTDEQRRGGVFTASVGNWAMALAYQGHLLRVDVTVVLPANTTLDIVSKCQSFGATVVLYGKTIVEAKRRAFVMIADQGHVGTYLNGYDHPHVIAAAGSIGIEILEQLPDAEAILVPIGGGGLIAGISSVIKHRKPEILIYGVEPGNSCSFHKAMDNERPYVIDTETGLATLNVQKPGDNAFHTARSLIDKMVLVNDDWTARAILLLAEREKLIVEGAGAISLGALMMMPDVLPELHGKKVVCIVSGGNINIVPLVRVFRRAKIVEGRYVPVTVRMEHGKQSELKKLLKVIENLGCNIVYTEAEREWLMKDKLLDNFITFQIETKDLRQAYTLKHVLEKLFPNVCEFAEETFKPRKMCSCFPKRKD